MNEGFEKASFLRIFNSLSALLFIQFDIDFDKNTQESIVLDLWVQPVRIKTVIFLDSNRIKITVLPGKSHWVRNR
jgi:hypothetical protein